MDSLYIFQNDLRYGCNPLLDKALKNSKNLTFVLIKPVDYSLQDDLGFQLWAESKKKFYLQALESLALQLESMGHDFVFINEKENLKSYISSKKVSRVYIGSSPFAYENSLMDSVPKDVQILSEPVDRLLDFNTLDLGCINDPSFTKFRKKIENLDWPVQHVGQADPLKDRESKLTNSNEICGVEGPSQNVLKTVLEWCRTELKVLDKVEIAFDLQGHRESGLDHLENYIWKMQHVKHYKKTRNGMIEFYDSSKMSGWLAVGALSPVEIFKQIIDYEKRFDSNSSTYWLKLELLWRDYFKLIAETYKYLFFNECGLHEDLPKSNSNSNSELKNLEMFENWKLGRTKNSFINANMIELKLTGFMSNRGRQNVASYLVHEMDLPWWWGAKWFESRLIDYDPASNYGNWQYVAGVGIWNAHKFDYTWQSANYDPDRSYQKKWLSRV